MSRAGHFFNQQTSKLLEILKRSHYIRDTPAVVLLQAAISQFILQMKLFITKKNVPTQMLFHISKREVLFSFACNIKYLRLLISAINIRVYHLDAACGLEKSHK